MSRDWRGPVLEADHRDLVAMFDAFAADNPGPLEDGAEVAPLVVRLAELGVWTLGAAADHGGGGADPTMTAVAFERMGRYWPALGWASVQVHVAADLIGASHPELMSELHAGRARVAVVRTSSPHVRLSFADGRLSGTVGRVDAAGPRPHLLVLDNDGTARLVEPDALEGRGLARTGLGGAFTSALEVSASADQVHELSGRDLPASLGRLWCGAAAVAAGIAGAAADGAASYAAGRRQFGDALTAIPTVRQSLLDQVADTVTALTASIAVDHSDLAQAYAAVSRACDGAIDVAAAALQTHGGYGYLSEYPAERFLRDAVSLRAAVDVQSAARVGAADLVGRRSEDSALGAVS